MKDWYDVRANMVIEHDTLSFGCPVMPTYWCLQPSSMMCLVEIPFCMGKVRFVLPPGIPFFEKLIFKLFKCFTICTTRPIVALR
ncbi:hypothetical protein Y032_0121g987 [Ancylostoma ceylanicum]|uniref:Uncharacterized protein n=1 Tax=Ancylostoma ceylanicum TaxID=53326 RepID=A0A016T9M9_9BILA|nr:hypothetical protein Y032_0121g987 [Ancylostoma ceylanicum]